MASAGNNNNKSTGRSTQRINTSKRSTSPKQQPAAKTADNKEMNGKIIRLIFVVVMLLLTLCNFHLIGIVGEKISEFQFGVFGFLAYITPIGIVGIVHVYRRFAGNSRAMKKLIFSIVLYFQVAMICHMFSASASAMTEYSFSGIYAIGKNERVGGGLIAGSIAYLIRHFLSIVGLVIILILAIFLCLVMLTEGSILKIGPAVVEFFKKSNAELYERREQRELENQARIAANERQQALLEADNRYDANDEGLLRNKKQLPAPGFNEDAPGGESVNNSQNTVNNTVSGAMSETPVREREYRGTVRDELAANRRERALEAKQEKAREKAERKRLRQEAHENREILKYHVPQNQPAIGKQFKNSTQELHEVSYSEVDYAQGYDESGYNEPGYNEAGYIDPGYNESGYDSNELADGSGRPKESGYGYPDNMKETPTNRGSFVVNQSGNSLGNNAYGSNGYDDIYKLNNANSRNTRPGQDMPEVTASARNIPKMEIRETHSVDVKEDFEPMSASESGYNHDNNTELFGLDGDDLEINGGHINQHEAKQGGETVSNDPNMDTPAQDTPAQEAVARKRFVAVAPKPEVDEFEWNGNEETHTNKAINNQITSQTDKHEAIHGTGHENNHADNHSNIHEEKHEEKHEDKYEEERIIDRPYQFPPIDLLKKGKSSSGGDQNELQNTADRLLQALASFGVDVELGDCVRGPSVTRYELILKPGVKVQKILSLADDIKYYLASADIRIEAPVPGKSAVGIEVPNAENEAVALRDLIEHDNFQKAGSTLSIAVGKNIGGEVIISDIAKMPHVLIAGATGSGKSVCINTLVMSILYKASPEDVQLIMVDPKVVELSVYNGIPHLLFPVVTDPKKASAALAWSVKEMDDRYKRLADLKVRDIKEYNEKVASSTDLDPKHQKMAKIVIIIDELADLMMTCGKEVEAAICRIAQLARACGIHLVVATQRPSVNVITGLIKANMPSRIAFAVSQGVDSRTILDTVGAEKLLGKGDMLFLPQGKAKPERVQGAFVSDEEVENVVNYLLAQKLGNPYAEKNGITENSMDISLDEEQEARPAPNVQEKDSKDELFAEAGRCVIDSGKGSIGYLQRKLQIGFNRAARIMDSLAEYNVVGGESGTKSREILMSIEEFEALLDSFEEQ